MYMLRLNARPEIIAIFWRIRILTKNPPKKSVDRDSWSFADCGLQISAIFQKVFINKKNQLRRKNIKLFWLISTTF